MTQEENEKSLWKRPHLDLHIIIISKENLELLSDLETAKPDTLIDHLEKYFRRTSLQNKIIDDFLDIQKRLPHFMIEFILLIERTILVQIIEEIHHKSWNSWRLPNRSGSLPCRD